MTRVLLPHKMSAPLDMATDACIAICVVVDDRSEVSLMCSISLLRLQQAVLAQARRFRSEVFFVKSLDEALNQLRRHDEASGALIVRGTMGFDPAFVVEAVAGDAPVVVAPYPLPFVDWDRVATQPESESTSHWGNVYNVELKGGPCRGGYVRASKAELGVAWVAKSAVADIVARHPELVTADGSRASLATAGVYEGAYLDEHARFAALYGGPVWVDIAHPATSSGPTEFVGCVGHRSVLR